MHEFKARMLHKRSPLCKAGWDAFAIHAGFVDHDLVAGRAVQDVQSMAKFDMHSSHIAVPYGAGKQCLNVTCMQVDVIVHASSARARYQLTIAAYQPGPAIAAEDLQVCLLAFLLHDLCLAPVIQRLSSPGCQAY